MDPLRVAIVGCGRAAERLHAPALKRRADLRLVAVADPRPQRAGLIADTSPGCLVFGSAEELIASLPIDALIISTPPESHTSIAISALKHGLYALVEKPLASSDRDIDELEAASASCAGRVMMAFNRRQWEPVRALRSLLAEVDDHRSDRVRLHMTTDITSWSPISGRSEVLEDLGTHLLDLLRYLFDRELDWIEARAYRTDSVIMRVTMLDGPVAEVHVAYSAEYSELIRVESGSRAFLVRAGSERLIPDAGLCREGLDRIGRVARRLVGSTTSLERSPDRQLAAFVDVIRHRSVPVPGLADGIAAVLGVDAARRSLLSNGNAVRVNNF
jgi:predicted dehydrogenase